MFPDETSPDIHSALSQASTNFPFACFAVLSSGRTLSDESGIQGETAQPVAQATTQQEPATNPNANQGRPADFFASPLVWLLPVWGAIVWLLLISTASEAWKLFRYNATSVKQGQRVPCKNCRFFSNNFYLKCAVRPSDALTEKAIDCSDFCQKSNEEELKPQVKRNVRH